MGGDTVAPVPESFLVDGQVALFGNFGSDQCGDNLLTVRRAVRWIGRQSTEDGDAPTFTNRIR